MNLFPDLLCRCPDTKWRIQLTIDNEIIDDYVLDTSQDAREELDIEHETLVLSHDHFSIVEKAMDAGKSWKVEFRCPSCGNGARISPDGPEIIEPNL